MVPAGAIIAGPAEWPAPHASTSQASAPQTQAPCAGALPGGQMPMAATTAPPPRHWPVVDRAAPFLMLYTSGTTGLPKGVPQTHANHLATYTAWAQCGLGRWDGHDQCLIALPAFHAIGTNFALFALLQGASVRWLREFSLPAMVDALAAGTVTRMPLVPTMVDMLTADAAIATADHRALRTIIYGGSSITRAVLERGMRVFDCDFAQCYGATETTAAGASLTPQDHRLSPPPLGTCGRPMPGVAVRIMGADGTDAAPGTVGEIWLSGPSVAAGYWNRADETAAVFVDGWYKSGDAGLVDGDGRITIVDRTRDMMISGGENVYPSQVEGAIATHPAVAAVAVFGVPDARWGHRIAAAIVAAPGHCPPTLDRLRAFLDPLIARYKHPRQL
ncbi:MAG: class I adenylate-forming enzyme family protein, partial [Sphingopyxis sp.]